MASVGFIGTGEIASAMVNGLTDMGHKIYVSKRGVKFSNKAPCTPPPISG